jgi:hypothetical protein
MCNRGTGYSSAASGPFSLEDLAADALAVLDHAGVQRAHVLLATCPPKPEALQPTPEEEVRLLTPPPAAAADRRRPLP